MYHSTKMASTDSAQAALSVRGLGRAAYDVAQLYEAQRAKLDRVADRLSTIQYLAGVRGRVRLDIPESMLGGAHRIYLDRDASVVFEYPNGATSMMRLSSLDPALAARVAIETLSKLAPLCTSKSRKDSHTHMMPRILEAIRALIQS